MTPEVLPPLPEVQTRPADLIESSNRRFEAGERSEWFIEMSKQLIDFEASGYQCLDILRPGEDNPTEAEIEVITEYAIEEAEVALLAATRELGGAMRRHAKTAMDHCPVDSVGYIYDTARSITQDDPKPARAGRRVKPEVYGRFGAVIGDAVDLTLERHQDPALGEYGLWVNGSRRPATTQDVDAWPKLRNCWARTLQAGVRDVMADNHRRRNPGQIVLKSLFGIYRSLYGNGPESDVSAQEQLEDGCSTATTACMRLAYAMDKYLLEEHGMTDPEERAAIIGRSEGPIGRMAGLTLQQEGAFAQEYLGAAPGRDLETDFTKIRTDMLQLGKNNRINFTQPIDELPLPNGKTVGNFSSIVRRIGCPILLTPKLVQSLWGSFVDSAAQAELI